MFFLKITDLGLGIPGIACIFRLISARNSNNFAPYLSETQSLQTFLKRWANDGRGEAENKKSNYK